MTTIGYTAKQIAEIYEVSIHAVHRATQRGKIQRIPGTQLYSKESVEAHWGNQGPTTPIDQPTEVSASIEDQAKLEIKNKCVLPSWPYPKNESNPKAHEIPEHPAFDSKEYIQFHTDLCKTDPLLAGALDAMREQYEATMDFIRRVGKPKEYKQELEKHIREIELRNAIKQPIVDAEVKLIQDLLASDFDNLFELFKEYKAKVMPYYIKQVEISSPDSPDLFARCAELNFKARHDIEDIKGKDAVMYALNTLINKYSREDWYPRWVTIYKYYVTHRKEQDEKDKEFARRKEIVEEIDREARRYRDSTDFLIREQNSTSLEDLWLPLPKTTSPNPNPPTPTSAT